MADSDSITRVFELVATGLPDIAAKELWAALKSELIRKDGGPSAMKEFLDSEAMRINQIIEQAIAKVSRAELEG